MSKKKVQPAPPLPTLKQEVWRALRNAELWQVNPILGAHYLVDIFAPKVAVRAISRGDDNPDMDYIEARLAEKLEAWLREKAKVRDDQIRADINAGATYFGRQSTIYDLTDQVLEEFGVPTDGNREAVDA